MEIQLRQINDPSEFRAVPLRDHASKSVKAAFTTHYAAISGEQEVAFVALDLPDNKESFCVYELLVDPLHRCRGYGTAVIRKCREFAAQEGFEKICLRPCPIEPGGSEEKLRAWYTKLGFVQNPEQSHLVEIIFTASPNGKIA